MTTLPAGTEPELFRTAVETLSAVTTRDDISVGPIRPPQRLAPFSYALGVEVKHPTDDVPEFSEGDAFGRLILLHDPEGDNAWHGTLRLVLYIQADIDASIAADPVLPEVAWSWLIEALEESGAEHSALGGTVTCTSSVRYGEISGPTRAHQVEVRASWTPSSENLTSHAQAVCDLLGTAAGLPPVGVSELRRRS